MCEQRLCVHIIYGGTQGINYCWNMLGVQHARMCRVVRCFCCVVEWYVDCGPTEILW